MIEGICLKKDVKIMDRQALWNKGVRFVYCDVKGNSSLKSVMGECEYQGFKFGGLARLRYNPGAGSADSQAFEFADALAHLPIAKMPPVLELAREEGIALPETNGYRDTLKDFLQRFWSYTKGDRLVLKMPRSIAEWLKPDQFLLDYAFNWSLWIHEPVNQPLSAGAFRYYTLRSYAERAVAGTDAEWVQIPGTQAQFDGWMTGKSPLRFLLNGGTPPQSGEDGENEPVPEGELSDREMIKQILQIVQRIERI